MERIWHTRILQTLLALSVILILIGGSLFLRDHAIERVNYSTFRPICLFCTELSSHDLGRIFMSYGIMVFIAIPILRIIFYAITFLHQHNKRFALLSFILAILLLVGYLSHFE